MPSVLYVAVNERAEETDPVSRGAVLLQEPQQDPQDPSPKGLSCSTASRYGHIPGLDPQGGDSLPVRQRQKTALNWEGMEEEPISAAGPSQRELKHCKLGEWLEEAQPRPRARHKHLRPEKVLFCSLQ